MWEPLWLSGESDGALNGIEKRLWERRIGQVLLLGGESCVGVVGLGALLLLKELLG